MSDLTVKLAVSLTGDRRRLSELHPNKKYRCLQPQLNFKKVSFKVISSVAIGSLWWQPTVLANELVPQADSESPKAIATEVLEESEPHPASLELMRSSRLPEPIETGRSEMTFEATPIPEPQSETQPITLPTDLSGQESTENSETPEVPNSETQAVDRQAELPPEKLWFMTLYGGTGTNSSLGQTLTFKKSEFYDSFFNDEHFIGLEVGRKILTFNRSFGIEAIGQARQHFGSASYLALETALAIRWNLFTNSNFLNVSLAVGEGISYVSDLPEVEASRPSSFAKSNFLNYLLIESVVSLPKNPDWSLVFRLNHRSGVFGIFNGATDGSNNLAIGIRRKF
jgi:hypothetical protein